MTNITLDLQITSNKWRQVRGLRARLMRAANATATALPAPLHLSASAAVLLGTNAQIKALNRTFRKKDMPTNVLSFPQFSTAQLRQKREKKEPIYAGDIALAYQYIADEARHDDKPLLDHATHLVVHGLLHLFGYDHIKEGEAEQMERMETRILKLMDIPNPYKAPSHTHD